MEHFKRLGCVIPFFTFTIFTLLPKAFSALVLTWSSVHAGCFCRGLRVVAELFAIKSSATKLGEHYCGGPDHEDTLNGGSGIHVARSGAGRKQ